MSYTKAAWGMVFSVLIPITLNVCMGFSLGITLIIALLILIGLAWRFDVRSRRIAVMVMATLVITILRLWIGEDAPPVSLPSIFERTQRTISLQINLLLPEPHAAFMAGLLTGERSDLPKEVLMDMRQTGLTHILAISGFNITLVLLFLEHACFFLPRRWRLIPLSMGVTAFTLMTGASASAVRACIMGILQLLALHAGRPAQMRLLLGWTAVGMLLWEPKDLREDLGLHLSFLAVVGLLEFSPLLQHWGKRFPEAFGIKEALLTTIAAQLTAAPWSAYQFGTLPLHSPFLNLFVAPLLPLSMLFGASSLVVSLFSIQLGQLLMVPAWLMLGFILQIAHLGSGMHLMIVSGLKQSITLLFLWCAGLWWLYRYMQSLTQRQASAALSAQDRQCGASTSAPLPLHQVPGNE